MNGMQKVSLKCVQIRGMYAKVPGMLEKSPEAVRVGGMSVENWRKYAGSPHAFVLVICFQDTHLNPLCLPIL